MLHQLGYMQTPGHQIGDSSIKNSDDPHSYCQKCHYNQMIGCIRELQNESLFDQHFYQPSPIYSPLSVLTPNSNSSGFSMVSSPYAINHSWNLMSPNSTLSMPPINMSSKLFERAHKIPERFWIDWQVKQMHRRIQELESIKNTLTHQHRHNSIIANDPNKSSSSKHTQRYITPPQSATFDVISSTPIDNNKTPSTNNHSSNLFSFDQSSIDKVNKEAMRTSPSAQSSTSISPLPKSPSTLDRSRLSIHLPNAYTKCSELAKGTHKNCQWLTKSTSDKSDKSTENIPSRIGIEDIAKIDTELNLTLLLRKNRDQTDPLLFSKVIINRTIEFQSIP